MPALVCRCGRVEAAGRPKHLPEDRDAKQTGGQQLWHLSIPHREQTPEKSTG